MVNDRRFVFKVHLVCRLCRTPSMDARLWMALLKWLLVFRFSSCCCFGSVSLSGHKEHQIMPRDVYIFKMVMVMA